MTKPPPSSGQDAAAHTELRRKPPPLPEAGKVQKPRTAPERLPLEDADGLEDLFDDVPV